MVRLAAGRRHIVADSHLQLVTDRDALQIRKLFDIIDTFHYEHSYFCTIMASVGKFLPHDGKETVFFRRKTVLAKLFSPAK